MQHLHEAYAAFGSITRKKFLRSLLTIAIRVNFSPPASSTTRQYSFLTVKVAMVSKRSLTTSLSPLKSANRNEAEEWVLSESEFISCNKSQLTVEQFCEVCETGFSNNASMFMSFSILHANIVIQDEVSEKRAQFPDHDWGFCGEKYFKVFNRVSFNNHLTIHFVENTDFLQPSEAFPDDCFISFRLKETYCYIQTLMSENIWLLFRENTKILHDFPENFLISRLCIQGIL